MVQSCKMYELSPKPIKILIETSVYYPLESNTTSKYKRTGIPTYRFADSLMMDTIQESSSYSVTELIRTISGNYLHKGRVYKTFGHIEDISYNVYSKPVRMLDGIYYEITYDNSSDSLETIFLKENLQSGDAWESNDSKFLVLSFDKIYNLGSVKYNDVIFIKRSYKQFSGRYNSYHSYHRYARGAGEIYTYLPYPLSGMYQDTEYKKIK